MSDPSQKKDTVPSLELESEEKRKTLDAVKAKKTGPQVPGSNSSRIHMEKPDKAEKRPNPLAKGKKGTITPGQPSGPKRHRFIKKNFAHPTWCPFHNKFISGLNKSGYECRDCHLPVSRRFIGEAKNTVCGEAYDSIDTGFTGQQAQAITKNKVFTVYLPHGAKKSVLLNPFEPLRNVLEKICASRGITMDEFVPEDTNGNIVSLDTTLGKITGYEITFTRKDSEVEKPQSSSNPSSTPSTPPPELEDDREVKKKTTKSGSKPAKKKSGKMDSKRLLIVTANGSSTPPSLSSSLSSLSLTPTTPTQISSTSSTTSTATSPVKRLKITEAYDIGKELGSGAFSVVKEAKHKETGRVVAVKVLDKYEDDDEQTQKFKQEISIISSLHHENIVQFYELDDDEENFYVAMELVGGGELFDYIIENGTIKEKEASCIIAQVLKAVEYMHGIGTAHRDLKPENLLFKSEDKKVIKIADFGESKSFKEGQLTTYCGTPDYMAPEIIKGEPYGASVDVWAIGVITYVMLAGFPPFDGENDVEVFASILAVRYDFPSPEWDGVSSDGKDFIAAILLEDPAQRMTATQCLNHPWIVKNVPLEMRQNTPQHDAVPSTENKEQNGIKELAESSEDDEKEKEKEKDKDKEKEKKERKQKKEKKDDGETVDQADESPGKRQTLLDTINDCLKNASESVYLGELKVMAEVVEVMTKDKSGSATDTEKAILNIYWARIKELQSLVKSGKKKKKK